MNDDYLAYFFPLLLGLYAIIKFREIGKHVIEQNPLNKYLPSPLSKTTKWRILFAQLTFLVIGIIMVLFSSRRLLAGLLEY